MTNETQSTVSFNVYYYSVLYGLSVFSLFGNAFVIIIFKKNQCFDSVANYLFINQAACDLGDFI